MDNWTKVETGLPAIGDYSVLAYFDNGGMDMVHVQDYFGDITAGLDSDGTQLYTKWYIRAGITHWMPMPGEPHD